ncbi:MAG: ribose 5-phosphate isomerase B [Flavobacteriales bacterium]
MRISLGSDHAGVAYKSKIVELLKSQNIEVEDFGPFSTDSVDYPDYIHPVAKNVEEGKADLGIVLCGSGNGAAMTANKYQGVRCGLVWTPKLAQLTRLHNNANIISIPARFIDLETTLEIVKVFISTEFEAGRHQRRVDKIMYK